MLLHIDTKINEQNKYILSLLEIKYNENFNDFFSYYLKVTSDDNIYISRQLKNEIKHIISINLWFINKIRRIVSLYKIGKGQVTNTKTLLLDDISNIQNDNLIKIYSNSKTYIFDIKSLIHIIHNALIYNKDGYPSPYKPKNPYTNTDFTYFDMQHIYDFISKSNLYKTNIMILYEMSNFNIENFVENFDSFICKTTTTNYINTIDYTEMDEIYKEFLNDSNIFSSFMQNINMGCGICINSFIENHREDIKPILSKYLYEKYTDNINQESVIMFSNLFLIKNNNQTCINKHTDTQDFVYLGNLKFNIGS